MTLVSITRFTSKDQGTFGRLVTKNFSCYTGELPWRNNAQAISCIPEGTYQVVWASSPRLHKFTYRLVDVPNRNGVLIHSSNLMGDSTLGYTAQLQGCISLGEKLGTMGNQRALLLSRPAVRSFEDLMQHLPFTLEITNA